MNKQLICKNLLISYMGQAGSGSEVTILFLHGWRSNKEVWGRIVESGKLSSFKVLAMDLPGFGQSQVPRMPMTVGDYAEVVAEFIQKLELKNVIIVGHSFGGRVGIKLASKYPSLISKLVLVDSAGFASSPRKRKIMGIAAKIFKPFFKPKFMQGLRKKIYKHIGSEDYLATPELQKTYVSIITEDLSEDMMQVKCSTLIINGENDLDTPVEFGQRMRALIPNSRFQILAHAGHFSFLDQPEAFKKSLNDFI